jgi:hypothetical protein
MQRNIDPLAIQGVYLRYGAGGVKANLSDGLSRQSAVRKQIFGLAHLVRPVHTFHKMMVIKSR